MKAMLVCMIMSPIILAANTPTRTESSKFKVESLDGKTLYYNVEQTIKYTGDNKIDKMTKYYDPQKKLAQSEHSITDFDSLKVELFDFDNFELGSEIDIKAEGDKLDVRVLEKKGEKVKSGKMTWTKSMMFAKSMSYYIERNWKKLMAKESLDLDMLVAAQFRVVGFKLTKTGEKDGLQVIRLEPSSFFIRQFVDPMDFYFRDGKEPKMVSFVGRTTIPIKGNGELVVRLNFE